MGISPAPRPSEGQGKRLERGGLVPSLFCTVLLPVFGLGHREPRRIAPRAVCSEGAPFWAAPWALTRTFFPRSLPLSLSQLNATTWCSIPPYTPHSSAFLLAEGGNAVRFLRALFQWISRPVLGLFFSVSWLFSSRAFVDMGGLNCPVSLRCNSYAWKGKCCAFLPGTCFWSLSVPFCKSPGGSSCRRVRQKNLVFPGISWVCRVWSLWFSLLFCFECTFLCVVFPQEN